MTEIQFNQIKERLTQWRQERHLTYENQQVGFLGNVFEEVSEYFRAKNDLEKIDALCDIVIFCFNSFDLEFKEMGKIYDCDATKISIVDITDDLTYTTAKFMRKDFKDFNNIYRLVFNCKHLCENLGFNFYQCMLQTIKEIESRTGFYDDELNKFIKDEGYYDITHLKNEIKLPKTYEIINMIEEKDLFLVKIKTPNTILTNKFKKWYKADYESCRL
ncbi:hypothetical protein BFU17_07955 [Campylobacter coli]|nr:hypothetical protein [Campylobacter coli]EFK9656487.1 hypothetical protein [Campylobacter jejuni]EAL0052553.1 hypothetical protein [Campylobacter coli]EAL6807425.1 hypothetical protein [Campylobacter coli]EIK4445043.1 hypothetical protein [Campylobacter coli]